MMGLNLRTILLRCLAWFVLSASLAGGGGCSAEDGGPGDVSVIYITDGGVSSVNLTSLGLPASATPLATYGVKNTGANINWTAGSIYTAYVYLEADEGKKHTCDTALLIIPEDCEDGSDGNPRTYLLQFSGNIVTVSRLDAVYAGVAF